MKSYAYENLLLIMDIAQKKTLMLCGDDRRERVGVSTLLGKWLICCVCFCRFCDLFW
jgi:hypothetical protein